MSQNKLNLVRETILPLTGADLNHVVGGQGLGTILSNNGGEVSVPRPSLPGPRTSGITTMTTSTSPQTCTSRGPSFPRPFDR